MSELMYSTPCEHDDDVTIHLIVSNCINELNNYWILCINSLCDVLID